MSIFLFKVKAFLKFDNYIEKIIDIYNTKFTRYEIHFMISSNINVKL
jgi:hypothetical protein